LRCPAFFYVSYVACTHGGIETEAIQSHFAQSRKYVGECRVKIEERHFNGTFQVSER
jgi:hypothetical protein